MSGLRLLPPGSLQELNPSPHINLCQSEGSVTGAGAAPSQGNQGRAGAGERQREQSGENQHSPAGPLATPLPRPFSVPQAVSTFSSPCPTRVG